MSKQVLRFPTYVPQFKIKKGYTGEYFAVFTDGADADDMEWLFANNSRHCFGAYDNAYKL